VDNGCDVISMSLGGKFTTAFTGIRKAILRARKHGLILVAAAGNYTKNFDVYPAAYSEVISCAATNIQNEPWTHSAWGNHVDVAAPGESVWGARIVKDDNGEIHEVVQRSSGTSYAAPHVAGIAALWLEYHGGRKALIQKYEGKEIQELFVHNLKKSATSIGRHYGAGLVNAGKTVFAPLELINP
jgi:serine protease